MKIIGVCTAAFLAALSLPAFAQDGGFTFDLSKWRVHYDDFNRYAEADWTLTTTEAGASSATEALTNIDYSALLITNDAADDDRDFYQTKEGYKYESTKRLYCASRFKVSDATQSDFVFGLQVTDSTPLAVSDGIWFQKDDGDANLDFHVAKASTQTDATAVATITSDTFVKVSFYYDASASNIKYYVNDVLIGSAATTNAPDTQTLAMSFGIQNGEPVAKTMTIDYVLCVKER